jgi:cytochrome c biogenesis protein
MTFYDTNNCIPSESRHIVKRDSRNDEAPIKTEKKKSFLSAAYDSLASVTLAIFLLIILAVTSIIGTVVLQKGRPEQYMQEYGSALYRFFLALGLDDMYRSWWFLSLLALLLLNITLCSIKRFPRTWRMMTQPPTMLDEGMFKRMKYRGSVRRGRDFEAAEVFAQDLLGDHFGKAKEIRDDDAVTFFIDKGWYGRLGAYITHLSILLLAVGAVYGGIAGFKGYVNVLEGQTIDRISLRGKRAFLKLPFQVRCDDFQVVYYPDTQQPKDYFSDLTVISGGREIMKKRIEVNHPLIVDGIYFYQSSYGLDERSTVTFQIMDPSGRVAAPDITVTSGQPFNVPGDPSSYAIMEIFPSYMDGQPAVRMSQAMGGGRREFYLAQAAPDLDRRRGGPIFFRLKEADILQYTGLQVAWDPGVPMVWVACTVMMIGLYITFFVPHRRVWIRVDSDPENTAVLVAGTINRNPMTFEREFEELLSDLKSAMKKTREKKR